MTEGESSTNSLKQQCATALANFGLSIDEPVDARAGNALDLLVLKLDQESDVLRIRCLEDGVSKLFVVKHRTAQDKLVSFALTAKLEKLLRNEHSVLAWTEAQSSHPLIPRRKNTAGGQAFWLHDRSEAPGQEFQEKECWSVSEYLDNGPAFNWLETFPAWSTDHARASGELLAKLHGAGRLAKEKLTGAESHQLASLLSSLPQLIATAVKAGEKGTQLKAVEDALGDAVTALTSGPNAAILATEEVIIHGDFHPGNLLFAGTAAIAAIDLDYAHLEHPLYDLAYAILMFAPTEATADCGAALLEGYCAYFQRTAQEPPSFLPTAAHVAAIVRGGTLDDSPFDQYVVVAASLILLWTLSPAGSKHPAARPLAKRMVSRISPG